MSRPAAAVGDNTAHGHPLSGAPGSTDVMIGGKPAWRAGSDFCACPLVDPATGVPHSGGVVVPTIAMTLINNLPGTVMGDQIMEVPPAGPQGPSNPVVKGEPMVLFG